MRRIEASRRNASALRLRFSQSLASLRQRLSQAKVRSTTQRRGSTTNPFVRSERLTTENQRRTRGPNGLTAQTASDAGILVKSPSLRKHGPLARLAQNEAASGE